MKFSFSTAASILFEPGVSQRLADLLPDGIRRIAVVTGSHPERHRSILGRLESSGYEVEKISVKGEPTVEGLDVSVRSLRPYQPDIIISIGGGSVVDTGKVLAALLSSGGSVLEYVEGVGGGQTLVGALPHMAVPTTAGSGSEVTRNAVVQVERESLKASLRGDCLVPRWAVIDPELTYSLPPEQSAYTGMDAFIQCLEAYLSNQANPLSDAVALKGIELAGRSLKDVGTDAPDPETRERLCLVSLCGGMALANAKLGAVHGFAAVIGGRLAAPHGALCASLLLPVLKMNVELAKSRPGGRVFLEKLDMVGATLTGNPSGNARYALAWIEDVVKSLPLRSLSKLGFATDQIEETAKSALAASSTKGNFCEPRQADLVEALQEALET